MADRVLIVALTFALIARDVLPWGLALAIIMFGLGLSLTVDDFRRVARTPRAVIVALVLQVLVLPVVAFGLVDRSDKDRLLQAWGDVLASAASALAGGGSEFSPQRRAQDLADDPTEGRE